MQHLPGQERAGEADWIHGNLSRIRKLNGGENFSRPRFYFGYQVEAVSHGFFLQRSSVNTLCVGVRLLWYYSQFELAAKVTWLHFNDDLAILRVRRIFP